MYQKFIWGLGADVCQLIRLFVECFWFQAMYPKVNVCSVATPCMFRAHMYFVAFYLMASHFFKFSTLIT